MEFDVENPLHIPVASLVIIEVEARPVLESKVRGLYDTCTKIWAYIQLVIAILVLLGTFGGILLFMVWLANPYTFGTVHR